MQEVLHNEALQLIKEEKKEEANNKIEGGKKRNCWRLKNCTLKCLETWQTVKK
mgnify:CR=1 FL=1